MGNSLVAACQQEFGHFTPAFDVGRGDIGEPAAFLSAIEQHHRYARLMGAIGQI